MIIITQLIYIVPGKEAIFDEFEAIALPAIARYNGRLLMRLRPDAGSYIENNIEPPYEIHLVEFETEAAINAFMNDGERQRFIHLKQQSIKSAIIIKGQIL